MMKSEKLCTLGDICVPEHLFDFACEYPGAAEYAGHIKTSFQLDRRTVLNGAKCPPESLIKMLSDPESFCKGLRVSSSGHWLCNDSMQILMHYDEPGYHEGGLGSSIGEVQSSVLKLFERYRDMDVFLHCCDKVESREQVFRIRDAVKKWNPKAKLLVWSSLEDFKAEEEDIVNMQVQISFRTGPALPGCRVFEGSWQISEETMKKLHETEFSMALFG